MRYLVQSNHEGGKGWGWGVVPGAGERGSCPTGKVFILQHDKVLEICYATMNCTLQNG